MFLRNEELADRVAVVAGTIVRPDLRPRWQHRVHHHHPPACECVARVDVRVQHLLLEGSVAELLRIQEVLVVLHHVPARRLVHVRLVLLLLHLLHDLVVNLSLLVDLSLLTFPLF